MNEQLLKDFIATAQKYNYDWATTFSKFPELEGYDQQLLKDYVATAEKYNYDYAVVNSKFPEFGFAQKKKEEGLPVQSPAQGQPTQGQTQPQGGQQGATASSLGTSSSESSTQPSTTKPLPPAPSNEELIRMYGSTVRPMTAEQIRNEARFGYMGRSPMFDEIAASGAANVYAQQEAIKQEEKERKIRVAEQEKAEEIYNESRKLQEQTPVSNAQFISDQLAQKYNIPVEEVDAYIKQGAPYKEEDYFSFDSNMGKILSWMKSDPVANPALYYTAEIIDDLGRAISEGSTQAESVTPSVDVMANLGKIEPEKIKAFAEAGKQMNSMPPSEEMVEFQRTVDKEGGGVWGLIKGLAQNPSVGPMIIASSLAAMANKASLAAAGTVVGGAAIGGAAAGGVTAIGTAVASLPYAMAAASTMLESGLTFQELFSEEMVKRGFVNDKGAADWDNEEAIKNILEDEDTMGLLRARALGRGVTIGSIDAIAGRIGTKIAAKPALSSMARVGRTAKTAGVEMVGGSAGEAAGRFVAGQKMDVVEIGLEGLAEAPMTVVDIAAASVNRPKFTINGEKINEKEFNSILKNVEDGKLSADEFLKMDVTIDNDKFGYSDRVKNIFQTNEIKKKVMQASPDLDEASVSKVVELEKELVKLKDNDTQVAKDKRAQITKQINEIQGAAAAAPAAAPVAEAPEVAKQREDRISEIQSIIADDDAHFAETGERKIVPGGREELQTELETLKQEQDAIQKQSAEGGVLRAEQPQVGLQEVGEGDKGQVTAQAGVAPAEPTQQVKRENKRDMAELYELFLSDRESGKTTQTFEQWYYERFPEDAEPTQQVKRENIAISVAGINPSGRGFEDLYSENNGAPMEDTRANRTDDINVIVKEDEDGNSVVDINIPTGDISGRQALTTIRMVVPKGTKVDAEAVKAAVNEQVTKFNKGEPVRFKNLRANEVKQSDIKSFVDAAVSVVTAPKVSPTQKVEQITKNEFGISSGAKPEKIIFLDVDGVITPMGQDVSQDAINEVNRIIEETDAYVVISSSRRTGDLNATRELFKSYGFKYSDRIIGETADNKTEEGIERDGLQRGDLIDEWKKSFAPEARIVSLDDSVGAFTDAQKNEHLVGTEAIVGMTPDLANKAIEMLNKKVPKGVSMKDTAAADELTARTPDTTKAKIIRQAMKAVKTVQSMFPDFDVVLHEDDATFDQAMVEGKNPSLRGSGGALTRVRTADGKTTVKIHINLNKASINTVPHEVAHAVMLKAFGDDPKLFKVFRDRISKVLSADRNKQLRDFADQYEESESYEEFLVELAAVLVTEKDTLNKVTVSRILEIINKVVSKITGGAFVPFKSISEATATNDLVDFFNSMSKSIAAGEAVEVTEKGKVKIAEGVVSKGRKITAKSVKDINPSEVRTMSEKGSKVSKGISVRKINGELVVSETEGLSLDYVKKSAPELFVKNANVLSKYPIVAGVKRFGEIKTVQKAQEVYDILSRQIADNLEFLVENFKKELRDIASLWYDGANIIAQNFSRDYGISKEQAAGIIASLSPQKDWYMNVRLAELVMMAFRDNPTLTNEMITKQIEIGDAALKEKKKDITKAEAAYNKNKSEANAEKLRKAKEKYSKKEAKNKKVIEMLKGYVGSDLNSLPNDVKQYLVRLSHEINTTKDYNILRPDGGIIGIAKNDDGSNSKVAWGSYTEIGKAVSIYLDGSRENITRSLGEQHKIRNFYNNIIDPMSEDKDVTMDTHAIAAALLIPTSGSSVEVKQNFDGGLGVSSSATLGIKGLYYAFANGYELAAKELGLLPRQVQSITWEAVRGLFTDKFKQNKSNVNDIRAIWSNYQSKKTNIDETRKQIVERAGGIKDPSWSAEAGAVGAGPVQAELGEGVGKRGVRGRGRRDGRDIVGGAEGEIVTKGRKAERKIDDTIESLDNIKNVTQDILDLENEWQGGVADFGNNEVASSIERLDEYDDYKNEAVDELRRINGDTFKAYRLISKEQLDDWRSGGDIGAVAVSLDMAVAESFRKFALNKNKDYILISFEAPVESFVMRGKTEEKEIVIDANQVSASEILEVNVGEPEIVTKGRKAEKVSELENILSAYELAVSGGYSKEEQSRMSANERRSASIKKSNAKKTLDAMLGFDIGDLPSQTDKQRDIKNAISYLNRLIGDGRFAKYNDVKGLSDAYIKAKEDNSNPELVKSVEAIIGEPEIVTKGRKAEKPSEATMPGYDATMQKVGGIIAKTVDRGGTKEQAFDNVMRYLEKSKLYTDATDVQREQLVRDIRDRFYKKEKAAPSVKKILGIKDTKKVTMSEKEALKRRLTDEARGARNAASAIKKSYVAIAEELNEMVKSGKISQRQMMAILKRFAKLKVLDETSVDGFVEYMANVMENAEYLEKISAIKGLIPNAKKNILKKIGMANAIRPKLQILLSIKPTFIPSDVFEKYNEIVNMFGASGKVLSLKEVEKVSSMIDDIINSVNSKNSLINELSDKFANTDSKVYDKDGKLDYAATVAKMQENGEIWVGDVEIMMKNRAKIYPSNKKDIKPSTIDTLVKKMNRKGVSMDKAITKVANQLGIDRDAVVAALEDAENKRKELIGVIYSMSAGIDETIFDSRDERADVANLKKLLAESDAIEDMSLNDLENIVKMIDNIQNGYLSNFAKVISEKIQKNKDADVITLAVSEANVPIISKAIAKAKTAVGLGKDKNYVNQAVKRSILFYIDQVLGNFKNQRVMKALFGKSAQALSKFEYQYNVVSKILEKAQERVAKSLGYDHNKMVKSNFKMMAYMLQQEFESNPNSKVVPAIEHLNETISFWKDNPSKYSARDIKFLQEVIDEYSVDGQISLDLLNESFNEEQREAIDTMIAVGNGSDRKEFGNLPDLRSMAEYTAAVIRGEALKPLNNYIHHSVMSKDDTQGKALSEVNNLMNPSTKAKSLISRTGTATPMHMDPFASVQKGAKSILIDYHLTSPVRTARMALSESMARINMDENMSQSEKKERKMVLEAIDNAYETALADILTQSIEETSFADDVSKIIAKNGYRAVLAGIGRTAAELISNMSYALFVNPVSTAVGIKRYRKLIMSDDAPAVMNAVGSTVTNRAYPADSLMGGFVDPNVINSVSGMKSSSSYNGILNAANKIYNKTAKKYVSIVAGVADTLITSSDKIISRPIWFGSFDEKFKEITGQNPDMKLLAKSDEAYMAKYKDALDIAREYADAELMRAATSNNTFMASIKGKGKNKNKAMLLKWYTMFNNFMTNFAMWEYRTSLTGLTSLMSEGLVNKKKGAAILAGTTARMMVYTIVGTYIAKAIEGMFSDDDDEDESQSDNSFKQELGQAFASSMVSTVLGRDFGQLGRALIAEGTEYVNEKYLNSLRNGEYDPYEDAISYRMGAEGILELTAEDIAKRSLGPYGPFVKVLSKAGELGVKGKRIEKEKEEAEAEEVMPWDEDKAAERAQKRMEREQSLEREYVRLGVTALGSMGLVPFNKDVEKFVNAWTYKSFKQSEKAREKERAEKDKRQEFKDRLLYDEANNKRYDSFGDMKKYNESLWKSRYREWNEVVKDENLERAKENLEEQKQKDKYYDAELTERQRKARIKKELIISKGFASEEEMKELAPELYYRLFPKEQSIKVGGKYNFRKSSGGPKVGGKANFRKKD